MSKIILDLCGGTGAWSAPYKEAGYDVRVITLPEYDLREVKIESDGIFFGNDTFINMMIFMAYLQLHLAQCFLLPGLMLKRQEI